MLIKSWNFSVRFVNGARNSYLDEKINSFSPTSRCTPNNAAGDLQKEENLRVQEGDEHKQKGKTLTLCIFLYL